MSIPTDPDYPPEPDPRRYNLERFRALNDPELCGADTPTGPCYLTAGHPVGVWYPGNHGHMTATPPTPPPPRLEVRKLGAYIPITDEALADEAAFGDQFAAFMAGDHPPRPPRAHRKPTRRDRIRAWALARLTALCDRLDPTDYDEEYEDY